MAKFKAQLSMRLFLLAIGWPSLSSALGESGVQGKQKIQQAATEAARAHVGSEMEGGSPLGALLR